MQKSYHQNIFLQYWLPVIIWGVVIFLFSSYPSVRASEVRWQEFLIKKSAHVFEYGVFATLVYRLFRTYKFERKQSGIYSFLIACLYGLSDEFHQMFTPGREPTIRDVMFDTFGAMSAIYIVLKLLPRTSGLLKKWVEKLDLT